MSNKKIKLFDPFIDKNEESIIKKVLYSKNWASGAGNNYVLKFEQNFKTYVNATNCVSVNSGTAALHLALSLFDIKNKEVILPSLSFVSTAHSIRYNGGIPIFVDVEPKTLCLDPLKIEKAITNKTKLVLPVHYAGMSCNMDKISKICKSNNLLMVEDAAHAAGTSYNKQKIGSHGNAVCFSFHPVKNLAMPTGGAITLNGKNSQLHETKLKSLRWCGITNRKNTSYDVDKLGWNYYLNEFSAAIGIEQLKKLKKSNLLRKKIAKIYSKEIELENKMSFDNDCAYHIYWIQVDNREKFMKKLKEKNIETGIHYKPIHEMSYYRKKNNLPVTNSISTKLVSIPIHPNLSNSDVDRIIKTINQII